MKKNVLFIMCDQLRYDYLGCTGHPSIKTPNIDMLAKKGMLFKNSHCNAPLCGPSRASFYTGRYMSSHGVMANDDPLRVDEVTLGDYVRELGGEAHVVGKSEGRPNKESLNRLDIPGDSQVAQERHDNGFTPFEQYYGLYPEPILKEGLGYNNYLESKGYKMHNPWENAANTATKSGIQYSGWEMRNAHLASDIDAQHSETAFLTDRAMEYISSRNPKKNWCLHLSYFNPHWPLLAPAPYHNIYEDSDVIKVNKDESEIQNPHPVFSAFQKLEYSQNYSDEKKRRHVIPTYMGLISEIDHHIGRLMSFLDKNNLSENTSIIFTSDHGDYLGDHWLGEKDLFHEASLRIPLIIVDPEMPNELRGTSEMRMTESVDIVPTIVDMMDGSFASNRMEGRSLVPLLYGENLAWRDTVFAEIDYGDRGARQILDKHPYECRGYMIKNDQWKYIYWEGYRPQLYDLLNDPNEFIDLGESENHSEKLVDFESQLFYWLRHRKQRTVVALDELYKRSPETDEKFGIIIGRW